MSTKVGVYEKACQPVTYGVHQDGIESVSRMVLVHEETGGHKGTRAVLLSLPRVRIQEKPDLDPIRDSYRVAGRAIVTR